MKTQWLMLRGWGRESRHWGEFKDILAKRCKTAVHAIDLPGVASNSHLNTKPNISAMVDTLRSKVARPSENLGVLGISMGGMIALEWSRRFPDDFTKGVVINTSAANFSSPIERMRPHALLQLANVLLAKTDELREFNILKMVSNNVAAYTETARRWSEIAQSDPIQKQVLVNQLIAASIFRIKSPIDIPFLVLASEKDKMVSSKCSKEIAQHFRFKFAIHPTAGHDLTLDDPHWVAEQIANFDI